MSIVDDNCFRCGQKLAVPFVFWKGPTDLCLCASCAGFMGAALMRDSIELISDKARADEWLKGVKGALLNKPQRAEDESGLKIEKCVLSCLLIDAPEVLQKCNNRGITPRHFLVPSHSIIFAAASGMLDRDENIDLISLTQLLRDQDQLDQCGGAAFITDLQTFMPSADHALYFIDLLASRGRCIGL